MISIKGITLTFQDLIFIASALVAGVKWYFERNKLPAKYQRILDKITVDGVADIINRIQAFGNLNESEKQIIASEEVIKLAEECGIKIPRTVAILLVQYVYAKIRGKDKKIGDAE